MRDISNVSGQELPSGGRLLISTLIALTVATILLLIAVLPAEYGLDPTGLGKKMGLTALHQTEAHKTAETKSHAATEEQTTGDTIQSSTTTTSTSKPLQKRPEKWRSHNITLTLPPRQGLEVKALIGQGERLLFQWQASGGTVSFDMHGNVVNAAEDDYTSFLLGEGEKQAAGTFEAPFSGLHGWYWENEGDQVVTITLETQGYYQDLVQ